MTILDSNIIVYSLYAESQKKLKAQEFIQNNHNSLCVAPQNILESIRVLTHPKFIKPMSPIEANKAVWKIVEAITIITPISQSLFLVRELIDKHNLKGNKIFDTYLAATAMTNGVFTIATDNVRDFSIYKEIKVINPFK